MDFNLWFVKILSFFLVCYNGKIFDVFILMKCVMYYLECEFKLIIDGFVDFFYVFREVLLEWLFYKFEILVRDIMGKVYDVYLVIEDVKVL